MKKTAIRTRLVFLIIFSVSCAQIHGNEGKSDRQPSKASFDKHPAKKGNVRSIYERARESLLAEKMVQADVLWVLTQLSKKDAEIESFIERMKNNVYKPFYVPGVFPMLPRVDLPEDPGRGTSRYATYVKAPFGQPEELALKYISDYIADECSGYPLTHQFMCLIWAEQTGLPLTDSMKERREQLWDKIYMEQCGMEEVDSLDLFIERVAIILKYASKQKVDCNKVHLWITTIQQLQLGDGSWPLSKTILYYDGGSSMLSSPRSHTTALAMMALDTYIFRGW